MSALQSSSYGIGRMAGHATFNPMNGVVRVCSWAGGTLSLLAFLFACPVWAAPQSSNVTANFRQAQALIQQGRFAEARSATLDELQKYPSSVEGYNLLGIIESGQQDDAGALDAFQEALHLAPNSTKTHNNLGDFYVAQKNLDLAEKEFRTVLRLDPGNRDGNYNLGVLLMIKGSPAEAIPHFERVRPQNLPTRFNLIRACFQAKRTADALRMATQLSAESKNDVQVHFSLGVLLASEKQYKAAQFELEKADGLQPATFEILYNLGQVLLRDGSYPKADLTLRRALELKPESAERSLSPGPGMLQ